jgi:hypothetical protein
MRLCALWKIGWPVVTRRDIVLRKSGFVRGFVGANCISAAFLTAQHEIRNSGREPRVLTFGNSFGLIRNVRIVLRARSAAM